MKAYYKNLKPFVLWRQFDGKPRWDAIFDRQAPLVVEIGFGNGDRLVHEAAEHPDANYIGIELVWPSAKRALRRIHAHGLDNVRIMQEDARSAFLCAFEPESLEHCYALFPCPWPKDRHEKHRLFSRGFLRLANSRLKSKSQLRIVTDSAPYRDWILEQSADCGFKIDCFPIEAGFNTRYENKWFDQGQREFYDIRLTKEQHIAIAPREDIPMQTHRVKSFDAETFQPQDQKGKPCSITFKDFVFDPKRTKALQRVVVVEDGFRQDCWIEISKQPDNTWHLFPAPGSYIVPSVGLQAALDRAAEAIQSNP